MYRGELGHVLTLIHIVFGCVDAGFVLYSHIIHNTALRNYRALELEQSRLMMENLALREKKVAAREREIKSFRKHGKGAR